MNEEQTKQIIDIINISIKAVPVLLSLITSIGLMIKKLDISDSKKEELIAMIQEAKDKVANLSEIE
jgi:Na+/melibiose symporter-like transporter